MFVLEILQDDVRERGEEPHGIEMSDERPKDGEPQELRKVPRVRDKLDLNDENYDDVDSRAKDSLIDFGSKSKED
jgi:hypothetical protein